MTDRTSSMATCDGFGPDGLSFMRDVDLEDKMKEESENKMVGSDNGLNRQSI